MPVNIERLVDERIIIFRMYVQADPDEDQKTLLKAVIEFKHEVGGHICRIMDFSEVQVGFSDMMLGMASEKEKEGGVNDPDVSTVFIATTELAQFGVKAFQEQTQYGSFRNIVALVSSREEAMTAARAEIAKWQTEK